MQDHKQVYLHKDLAIEQWSSFVYRLNNTPAINYHFL